jgi:hypothetical protein
MSSTMRFLSYLVTLLVAVFITACGGGGGSAGIINPGSSDALRTDVPAGLTFVVSEARSFTIAGGKAPYSVISNSEGTAVAGVDGSTLFIGGVFPGTAELTVRDALGQTVKASVTITENGLALATTAPSALTMAMGQQLSFPVRGGIAPYAVSSANPNIVAASISGHTLSLTGITPGGPVVVTIRDSLNATVAISVTVTPVGGLALFTTAPSPLTLPIAATQVFSVGGGVGPYVATSSNTSIAQVTVAANTLTIQGIAGGSATITVRDAQNTTKTIEVTVPPLAAVFTTAPANLNIAIGSSPVFTIGGGTGTGYKVTSSNEAVAFGVIQNSTELKITALKTGSAGIVVRDSAGNSVTVSVTVPAPLALFTTAPSPVTIAVASSPTFTIGGGMLPYVATTSNSAVATASVTNNTTLTIRGVAIGSTVIQIRDALGTLVPVTVNVASASSSTPLFTSAAPTVTLPIGASVTYSVGGGTKPYAATSSNPSVLTVVPPGNSGNLSVNAVAAGSAKVVITDALGQDISFDVTVSAASSTPLFTSAPPNITMANGSAAQAFTVGGGTAPYFFTSDNTSVVTVTPATAASDPASMTLTPGVAGTATVQILDSAGGVITIGVTVSSSSSVALFTTAPSTVSVEINTTQTFTIGGGGPGNYSFTNTQPSVASAVVTGNGTIGGTLKIHGILTGSSIITVFDSLGASVPLTVNVIPPGTTLALLPAILTISETQNTAIVFKVSGGTPPYSAFSSNTALAPVTSPVVGTDFTVGAASRCVAANTPVTLTVVDAVGATKTSTLNITDINGAAGCPP